MTNEPALHVEGGRMWRGVFCAARWTLGVALIGCGVVSSFVTNGLPLVFVGLAVLLCPWIVRTARGDFPLAPRDGLAARRTAKRVGVVVGIGLLAVGVGLVVLAISD